MFLNYLHSRDAELSWWARCALPTLPRRRRVGKGAPATCPPKKSNITLHSTRRILTWVLLFLPSLLFAAPQDIIFWHSMAGQLGQEVIRLAQQFNQSQKDYRIVPIYKGDYVESLTSFAAAFRAKNPPQLIQVFEVGSSVMRFPKGIVKPVDVLMHEQGMVLPKEQFFNAVRENYSENGKLLAMPFNVSVPVLFYNAEVLEKLGVTSQTFPQTWDELELLAKRLHETGFSCAYTTAYPAWVLIESFLSLHGKNPQSVLASVERMQRWQSQHYFMYGGRGDDATVLFTSGKCPLFSQSSGGYAGLKALVPFRVGVAPLPIDEKVSSRRHNNVVGGAALWVVAGQSSQIERGIAQFLVFLANPSTQQSWYEHTGYLPLDMHLHPSKKTRPQSILEIAEFDLNNDKNPQSSSDPEPKNQIRSINEQMLEAIFSGMMSIKEAMENAVIRTQHVLLRFRKNTNYS